MLVGRIVELERPRDDSAQVFLQGAWWKARSRSGALPSTGRARVVDVEGLTVVVEPLADDSSRDPGRDQTNGGRDE